ncbi:MAG: four helix bundle protein [Ferruginibacter sp.]
MHNFKELKFWQKAVDLSVMVYKITANFPAEQKFGLVSQLRRATISIASNIAEGASRNSDKEFLHFLSLSTGSAFEIETQLIIATKLNFVDQNQLENLLKQLTEIQKMIYSFSKKLKENN